jgi:hypothetical protein
MRNPRLKACVHPSLYHCTSRVAAGQFIFATGSIARPAPGRNASRFHDADDVWLGSGVLLHSYASLDGAAPADSPEFPLARGKQPEKASVTLRRYRCSIHKPLRVTT